MTDIAATLADLAARATTRIACWRHGHHWVDLYEPGPVPVGRMCLRCKTIQAST